MMKTMEKIEKVKSVIITTDKEDMIFTPCENSVIELITTETYNPGTSPSFKNEVIIKTEFTRLTINK